MSKKTKEIVETDAPKPNFTRTALCTYCDADTGTYCILTVQLDPVTLQAGQITKEDVSLGGRAAVLDQFKIRSVQLMDAFKGMS